MIKLSKIHSNLSHKIQESIVKNFYYTDYTKQHVPLWRFTRVQKTPNKPSQADRRPPGAKGNCGWRELLQRIPLNKNPSANSDPKKMEFDSGILKNDIFSLFGQLFLVLEQSLWLRRHFVSTFGLGRADEKLHRGFLGKVANRSVISFFAFDRYCTLWKSLNHFLSESNI